MGIAGYLLEVIHANEKQMELPKMKKGSSPGSYLPNLEIALLNHHMWTLLKSYGIAKIIRKTQLFHILYVLHFKYQEMSFICFLILS